MKYDSDLGIIYELFILFLHIKTNMIKRNIKREASGMMLNKPVHKKTGISSECQQILATDLIHTSCHIWSLPWCPPCWDQGCPLHCGAGYSRLQLCSREACSPCTLLRGRKDAVLKLYLQRAFGLPATPASSLDVLGNRILNYL